MPENNIQYVIKSGGFEEGYELVGPFDGFDDASNYVDEHIKYSPWEIIMVQKPLTKDDGS